MNTYCDALQTIGNKIEWAKQRYQCQQKVSLLAVSKRYPTDAIAAMFQCGHTQFGENYVSEMVEKALFFADLPIEWHYIGPIQSNKTRAIANIASWVHSIDRLKVAKRLNNQRSINKPPLQVCIQVNISQEGSKSGVSESELGALVEEVLLLPNLRLRGLMVIPKKTADIKQQRQAFTKAKACFDLINQQYFFVDNALYPAMDVLSMGMSGDLEAAIAEGSTMIRIGTDLFGSKPCD